MSCYGGSREHTQHLETTSGLLRRERGEVTYHGLVDGVAGHEAQEGADDDDGEADVRAGGDQGVEGHGLLERLVVDDQDGDGQRL